jgi:pimeloyl-ACP methyl ester carboxylesterase
MEEFRRARAWRTGLRGIACVAAVAACLSGCKIRQVAEQSERIDSAGTLQGTVTADQVAQGDVLVAVMRRQDTTQLALYRLIAPDAKGAFAVTVPAGEFYVGAFVDENHDGHLQAGEPAQLYGKPTSIKVDPMQTVSVALVLTPASKPAGLDLSAGGAQQPQVGGNMGAVTAIDDPRFEPDNGLLGMWRPLDFMAGPQGGLFMLSEYDPGRIPVLFIHGIAGTPRDFTKTLEGIDLKRYQPWVFYYPSGIRLDMISNGLANAMHLMQRRYGFSQYAIVAHSMGGLVARSYVQKYAERYPDEARTLRVFVTVNSPQGGMSSAAMAVESSPIVVPAWMDVAEGSEFMQRLERYPWPADLPYYLFFSFDGDKNGDGTVPLKSQLPFVFQSQARRMYGLQGSHVGALSNPEFIGLLNELLDASTTAPKTRPAARN